MFIDEMISRAYERISINEYFDLAKVNEIKQLHNEMQQYFDLIQPIPYLDDISTKNLLIDNGKVSSVIDIDWIGLGDILTFVAMTKVALLNMDLDTIYIDFLLEEVHPSEIQYKAFVFYCLLYCVDFMSERGMDFLDKKIPIELSRCATACQGCGAVFISEKGSDKTLPKDYRLSATKNIILSTGVLLLLPYEKITIASSS